MANKTIDMARSVSSGSYIIGKIVCDSTADYAANNSDVTCRIYVRKDNDDTLLTIPTSGTWSYSMTINGKTFSGTVSKDVLRDWVLLATASVNDIAHNDDGTKSITVVGYITGPNSTSFAGHKISVGAMFALDTVPRASTIASAGNVTLGNNCNVKFTPASASFRYKLNFKIGSWSHTTDAIHPNRKTQYTYDGYKIPLEVATQVPNSKTGTMTVTLSTFSDAAATKQVGSADTDTITVTVPSNDSTKPKVSMVLSPEGSLPSAFDGLYIQGKSKVKAAISAEGKYDATIKSYSMSVEGEVYDTSDDYTSKYLTGYGSVNVVATAKDSRGYYNTDPQSINVIAYSKPKIMAATDESDIICGRCDSEGKLSDSGTFLKIKARRSYSKCVDADGTQRNFCQIRYRYKSEGGSYSSWKQLLAKDSLGSNTINSAALLNGALNVKTTYIVQIGVIDDVGGTASTTISVPTESVHTHRTKNGMGLGKYVEEDDLLDCAWNARFRKELRLGDEGNALTDFVIETGVSGGWRYKKWNSGIYEMYGTFDVQAKESNATGAGYYSDQIKVEVPFAILTAHVSGTSGAAFFWIVNGCIPVDGDNYIAFRIMRFGEISTTSTYEVRLSIRGRWK